MTAESRVLRLVPVCVLARWVCGMQNLPGSRNRVKHDPRNSEQISASRRNDSTVNMTSVHPNLQQVPPITWFSMISTVLDSVISSLHLVIVFNEKLFLLQFPPSTSLIPSDRHSHSMYNFFAHITAKQILGLIFGLLSEISLFLNIITLISVFRLAFISRKNQVYIIAFFNSLCDVFHMLLNVFYLAPSIVFSIRCDLPPEPSHIQFYFYQSHFLSPNSHLFCHNVRFAVCQPVLFVSISFPFHNLLSDFGFLFDHEYLSYSYYTIEGVSNYSNYFDVPLNVGCSLVSTFCYLSIFWTVHKTIPSKALERNAQKVRRNRDIRYAIQFSVLFVFHTIGYILLRVLPKIFNEQQKEWCILVPFSFLLDCSANAVIYLGFNVEVQNSVYPTVIRSMLKAFGILRESGDMVESTQAARVGPENTRSSDRARSIPKIMVPKRRIQPFLSIGLRRISRMI